MPSPTELLSALSRAFVLTETLSGDDPELQAALADAVRLHEEGGWQVLRVEEDGLSVNRTAAPPDDAAASRFREALEAALVSEVRFQGAVPPEVLEDFLRRLHARAGEEAESGSRRFRGLEGTLGLSFRPGTGGPLGMAGAVQGLFTGESQGPAFREKGPDGGTSEFPGAPGSAETEGEGEGTGARLPRELSELVASYLARTGPAKVPLGEAIAAAAARLAEARDQESLVNLVEILAEASEGGEKDPAALELAIRLTSTGVASRLVGRLGATRDEEERRRLIKISARLGREMTVALADALGEARDRYQRRTFMDAMIAHGDLAREMAAGMVEDPRWYVVRNGVALLGELGGENAVSQLTGTLAAEDARVRKETVQALAKMGGEDASMLLLGMLEDSDAEVRAKACNALGILRVEKAFKPLLTHLEKDSSEEVQIQCLNALGKLGDPGAVPLIEKKTVGRLFSRPSKEIRLAAFKALAAIGTPHARSLLLKATKDSDAEIRKLALGLLE